MSTKSENSAGKKKGHEQVKDSAKIVCFKCKVEWHHVRSCPLKKKSLSEKQQGKRPQDQLKLLKLKKGHFPRSIKLLLPKLRFQLRRVVEADVATYAVRRATLRLPALTLPYPTVS